MPTQKRKRGTLLRTRASKRALKEDPTALIAKADKRVLELLTELGSDANIPYHVSFWMYFPKEEQAYKVAAELGKQKFEVEVSPPLDGYDKWLCLAFRQLVPRFATIDRLRKRLTELTTRYGGEFDGWEMEVKNNAR